MKLATVNSLEEHQYIDTLIRGKSKDKKNSILDIVDQQLWISKSTTATEKVSKWIPTQNKFPGNCCISWYWMSAELCFAFWPLANEWNHEDCGEERYFICEQIHESEIAMLKMIEDELITLVDELMFTGFADALPTTTDTAWMSLVQGALQTWLIEQQQISKSTTVLDEQVNVMAAELAHMEATFNTDELKQFVFTKFETMNDEDRVHLLSERFRNFIGDEYKNLGAGTNWSKSPTENDVDALVKKVLTLAKVQEIKLASEELAKFSATEPTDVLDEDFMNTISQQLLKFSENEFESYVLDVMAQLENYGVEEVDMNMLLQLYLLVKQELFSLIAKTLLKATSKERIEITSYGLSRILEGKQLVGEDSVFGQIFVMLGTGTAVLAGDRTVQVLDDVLIRTFVKKEILDLRHEDLLKLKYEGYIKFVIDEVIKLAADINLAKNDLGELLLNNVVDLIATQFLFYAEEELKTIAERLTKSIEDESNKLQKIVEQMKISLAMYDEDKLLKLIELVQRELFRIIVKSLKNFSEKDMLALAEEALTKIIAEDKPTGKDSVFGKVFVSIGEELSKLTKEEFTVMKDEDLMELVKSEFEKANYQKNAELFEQVYMSLITEEFIKLVENEAVLLSAHEEETHQFGEMVKLIAGKLLEIASNESVFIESNINLES